QGQSSGVQVTAVNGSPGATAYVKIRGTGSINAGNEPLFVIDGVPSDAVAYSRLNPNDIERMDVLKDAAAASIYGSRGSNGVVVITTKRGKAGQPKISYSFMYGVKKKTDDQFDMMNAEQKLQYEYDFGHTNQYISKYMGDNGYGNMYDIPQNELDALWDVLIGQSHDWQETLLRPATVQSHEISLSGGAEKLSYYFSTSIYEEDGISYGSNFNRITSRLNLDYQATDWFKIGNTMSVGYTEEEVLRDRYNVQNPFNAMYSYNPYEPEYNADGSYNKTHQGFSISEAIEKNPETQMYLNFQGTVFGEFKPMDNLRFKTQLGLNVLNKQREVYVMPGSILDEYVGDPAAPGSKTDNGYYRYTTVWTNTASYLWEVGEDHSFNALAGTEATQELYSSYTLSSKGMPSDKLTTQDNASEATNASTSKSDWALFSIFGSLSYSYQGKYNIEGSVRRDGSSRFGDNNKYGVFWATSAAWNIHEESFMEDSDFMNVLKLRASFGTSGNMNIFDYASLGLYQFGSYDDKSTMLATQIANPDLTWEKNQNWSIGLDYAMLNHRLKGSVDYYQRRTYDLLLARPLSMTTGFSSRLE
ncbi:MAG: SusC/RagA family TonB-linked outer membrane protein, partial [Flavobacteriales bacterium]|nr:SusC/RagA family TonB-linked outer membrane protein [Flavobacteriales bacterium]